MNPMKILIVDDDPHVLGQLPKAFALYFPDAVIDGAWSFPVAEKQLATNQYDIILLDGELSQIRTTPPEHAFGYSLVKPIRRSASKSAKIIMISNHEDMAATGLSLGADLRIRKDQFFENGKVVNSLDTDLKIQPGIAQMAG